MCPVDSEGWKVHFAGSRTSQAERLRAHRNDLAAILSYGLMSVLFLWKIAALGMAPAGYDTITYFYPYKWYLADAVHQGRLPLWNPAIFMGAPLLANIQSAALYPLDILFYLLPTVDALRYSVVLHIFLGAVFAYIFGRVSLRLSPSAAWVGGAVFGFSGYLGAQVGHLNQLHAAVWLPVLLLCLERASAGRSLAAAVVGGLALTCQILAGHTQLVYYSGWMMVAFAAFLTWSSKHLGVARLAPLVALLIMVVVGLSVAGVQLLPTLELAGESYRAGGMPFPDAVVYSVHLKELGDSLLPLYYAAPYIEVIGFTGLVSLALVPAALTSSRKLPYQWFFAAAAAASLLLSLGNETPIYDRLYWIVPGLDHFRAPARWLFTYNFSVSVLSGIGFDALRSRLPEEGIRSWLARYGLWLGAGVMVAVGVRLWLGVQGAELMLPAPRVVLSWWLFSGAGVAASLAVRARPSSKLVAVLLMALLLVDLYLAKEPLEYDRPAPAAVFADPVPLRAVLSESPPWRVLSVAGGSSVPVAESTPVGSVGATEDRSAAEWRITAAKLKGSLTPNILMTLGLAGLDGYDGGLLPTRYYARLKQVILGSTDYRPDLTMQAEARSIPSSRVLGAWSVRYAVVDRRGDSLDEGWEDLPLAGGPPGPRILVNTRALPRARVVHEALVLPDEGQQLEAVRTVDLGRVVVLGEDVGFVPSESVGADQVSILRDEPERVDIQVSTDRPGFLVLADSFYPGWKAWIDGRQVAVLRADFAVRAVMLEAGEHVVSFAYEPDSFKMGLLISLVGLSSSIGMLLLAARSRG